MKQNCAALFVVLGDDWSFELQTVMWIRHSTSDCGAAALLRLAFSPRFGCNKVRHMETPTLLNP